MGHNKGGHQWQNVKQPRGHRRDRDETPEFADRLVAINRVSKTVKGGKRFGFAALLLLATKKAVSALAKVKRKRFLRRSAKPQSKPSVK